MSRLSNHRIVLMMLVAVTGAIATLTIHFGRLYDASVFSDSIAHLGAGLALGGFVYLLLRRYTRMDGRVIDAYAVTLVFVIAVLWEVAEGTFVPYAGLDVTGWDDTIKDVALGVLGSMVTVWVARKYRVPGYNRGEQP